MLVIKIELWPYGDSSKATLLGQGTITNDRSSSDPKEDGNYDFTFKTIGDGSCVWKIGR